ncbi:MAG: sigma-54-dependent Fis family transcriptional regulator [Pseudomonadales bacterium]|nr:sigma-54-dependent Fis family transcriptional regulator [Pseudomonadales bacterium]
MQDKSVILVVDDDESLREAMRETLALGGFRVRGAASAAEAIELIESTKVSLVISDVQMDPMDGYALLSEIKQRWRELPVVLVTAYGGVAQAVKAIQAGAADYLQKPFDANVLIELASRYVFEPVAVEPGLIAADPHTTDILALASRVAASDATVMITGESGTGKEVFARYIHNHSPRSGGPFVAINCAAIPETMLESILFGYEKGAFTSAYRSSPGKFEQANGGTLLLDEISEMDIGLQAKLLRVLQEKEVERLGGTRAVPLNVRVLATTNRDLREQVACGEFREDLFYRLNVFPMHLPPLRERPLDIVPLAQHFARRFAGDVSPVLTDEAMSKLLSHRWPGNVRELENVMHRASILMHAAAIGSSDIQFENTMVSVPAEAETSADDSLESDLKTREQALISEALRASSGNRKNAAERLGISPRTLRYKLAKFRADGISLAAGA